MIYLLRFGFVLFYLCAAPFLMAQHVWVARRDVGWRVAMREAVDTMRYVLYEAWVYDFR